MPRLVDHAERRLAIVGAAWRLIAARGIDATNMRDLAREAGYTNGALSHYFSGKNEILRAAFEHVFNQTNARIERSVGHRRGLAALRRLCREVMPQTEETLLEARIAVSLWQRALNDPYLASVNAQALNTWRAQLVTCLRQAREDGEIGDIDETLYANLLMTSMVGMQVTGVLDAESASAQEAMIEQIIDGARSATTAGRRRNATP
ncbi:TetR/AcrR family transcriptional regulator [Mycobacterium kyogaense]|uniref:TetR/AcrR family transcriptional regulator n=1 Tax=Mycobacterium kyogaense TaxID=2212479 RepID=UPI000DAD93AC|nr:TetR/AcrR family transcriptional regulator [Mycobacterium kyogaense]